jgi:hypothetical protein
MMTSVFVGMSLDGFIARRNNAFEFLSAGGAERENGYEEFFATVDATLSGGAVQSEYPISAPG